MSAFVVSNIATDLKMLSNDQRFIFGNNALPEPLAAFKIDNIFVPIVGTPSVTNFETRNNTLSGFRWVHTTNNGDTFGSLKLQSFVNAQSTGTDILLFNQDGSTSFNNLEATSPFHIRYNAPLSALYLRGPSTTAAGFVYNNNLLETVLFSANHLRISSNTGQIHFSLDSSTSNVITFNDQGFKSIVNFIANNPDTSGLVPEKGLILETSGTERGAVTFDHVDNQMKIYTSGNDPITFGTNNTNAIQILTSGNIDLLNHRITNAADPVDAQDYVTKNFLVNFIPQVPATVNVVGATQTFLYSSNYVTSFVAKNNNAPTSGNPSSISLDLTNNADTGYRFKHQITDTDAIGDLKFLHFNSFGETTFFTADFSPFTVPQITIAGDFIVSGNSRFQYCTFNGPALFNDSIFVPPPTTNAEAASKYYVDISMVDFTSANALKVFNFSSNSNVTYRINNTLAPTVGTPSTLALSLNNSTNGGYRFLHTITNTDVAGLGTLRLQALNSSGVSADLFTASVNTGTGIPDTLFNGTATFNNAVTIQNNQSLLVTGSSAVADYLTMNNTNPSAITQLRINSSGLPMATFGYDGANSQFYIDSPFGGGVPFTIKFGGTTRVYIDNATGNIGINGNTNPQAALHFGNSTANRKIVLFASVNNDHQFYGLGINAGVFRYQLENTAAHHVWYAGASTTTSNELARLTGAGNLLIGTSIASARLVVNGGIQNIAGEETAIRVISALNNVKIELQCTSGIGRLYEIRSTNTGSFDITDRTISATRLFIDTTGLVNIPSGVQFNNSNASPLTYYADVSITSTWSGFSVISLSRTIRAVRVGKMVTLYLQGVSGTVTSSGAISSNTAIGTDFRPASPQQFLISVTDNSTTRVGILTLVTGGTISFVPTTTTGASGTFTTGTCGLSFDTTINYLVA